MSRLIAIAVASAVAVMPAGAHAADFVVKLNGTFDGSFQGMDLADQDLSLLGFYEVSSPDDVTPFEFQGATGEFVRFSSLTLSIGGFDYDLGTNFVFGTGELVGGVEILGIGQLDGSNGYVAFQPFDIQFGSAGFSAGINYLTGVDFQVSGLTGGISGGSGRLSVNAVPEPATWAMMIAGFGMVGFAARRRSAAIRAA